MADDVGICNLSLAHLGDDADVSSIDPPEGSAQAEHCAIFYPIARDALMESHTWGMCTRRIAATLLTERPISGWQYAYAKPANTLKIISITPPGSANDYVTPGIPSGTRTLSDGSLQSNAMHAAMQQTQPYVVESNQDGDEIILTNQAEAVIRYTARITDATKFSPLFTVALSRLLSSYLAGPVLKGKAGRDESKAQYQLFGVEFNKAIDSDSSQREVKPEPLTPWITCR